MQSRKDTYCKFWLMKPKEFHLDGRWKGTWRHSRRHPIHVEDSRKYRTGYHRSYLGCCFARIWRSFGCCRTKPTALGTDRSKLQLWLILQNRSQCFLQCSRSWASQCGVLCSNRGRQSTFSKLRPTHRFSCFGVQLQMTENWNYSCCCVTVFFSTFAHS